jgi:hypothetical protein
MCHTGLLVAADFIGQLFKVEISAETINQLPRQASRAEATLWQAAAGTHEVLTASNEQGPAEPGGSQMIKGCSFSKCPRRDTPQNCSPSGRLAIAADLPIG